MWACSSLFDCEVILKFQDPPTVPLRERPGDDILCLMQPLDSAGKCDMPTRVWLWFWLLLLAALPCPALQAAQTGASGEAFNAGRPRGLTWTLSP